MKTIVMIGMIAALLLPTLGMAAERAITISSLNRAYDEQLESLNDQINATTYDRIKLLDKIGHTKKRADMVKMTAQAEDDKQEIAQLEIDKRTVRASYKFLMAALQ